MKNYIKLEIAAVSENESFARSAVAAFALTLNPTLTELSDIKTAVSEAVTNSIVHAYGDKNGKNTIIIECRAEKRGEEGILHITVTDGGCGIADIKRAIEPFYTTLEAEERSGMGFTIMKTFMDGLSVESEQGRGTRVSMFRRIKGALQEKITNEAVRERANA